MGKVDNAIVLLGSGCYNNNAIERMVYITNDFSHSSGGWKSTVNVLADLVTLYFVPFFFLPLGLVHS